MSEYVNEYTFPAISDRDRRLPFVLATVGKEDQKKIYRPSGIEHRQFLFTLSGAGETVINGKKYEVTPNTLMYHAPNDSQYYYPVSGGWNVYWITFWQSYDLFSAGSGVYQIGSLENCLALIDEIFQLEQNVLYGEQASVLLYKIILEVNKYIENVRYNESSHKLRSALDYINNMYSTDIELEFLSNICGLSKEYFCRLFKKTYGLSPFAYIRGLRMQEAKKRLLLDKKQSLSEIAQNIGYHSTNYFVTDFKRFEGITPTEFRNRHQCSLSAMQS